MRQTSIKSDRVAELIDRLANRTGKSKVEAVTEALEQRLRELESLERVDLAYEWLTSAVWPQLPDGVRGRAPSKEEQEELLGY